MARAARKQPRPQPPSGPTTLDELAGLSVEELTRLYRSGTVPESLHVLDGTPTCRMLAPRGPIGTGTPYSYVRAFAAHDRFPWRGKSFTAQSDAAGRGINRVSLGVNFDLFGFETRIEPSAIDGNPCILLDYDLRANPWVIRKIRDELREVSEGLFFGPAMVDGADPTLVLYFAVDTRY